MNSKVIILILNAIYLIVASIWAIRDISFETILAFIGGLVSLATFFVANNNSFSVTYKEKKKQMVDNKKANISRQYNIQGDNYETNL